MKSSYLLRYGAITLAIALAPFTMYAGNIQGTTTGTTVTGTGIDDFNTASTINITFFNTCYFITNGLTASFPAYQANTVFAGASGVGSNFTPIDPSDFSISQYKPWVVNNNPTTNNITGPDSGNYNRGVTGQDAGGADIVISYTPLTNGDPTNVNFVQAFIQNTNNAGFTTGTIDNLGAATPYYNDQAVAGTGTTAGDNIPLVTNKTTAAWLVDIPYRCENGNAANLDCTGGTDDTLLSQVQTFQTFIESDQQVNGQGQVYHVLYGGVQWGYSYSNADTPEPSTFLLLGFLFAAAGLRNYCKTINSTRDGRLRS